MGSGGANAWAGITVDEPNAMVFAATGSASFNWYGVNRHGDNLFADSVLALDARTGRRVWHYQIIKHDLWDWDLPAAPSLVTVTRAGRPVEAVAQLTKHGYVFVLDRKTGMPLFPVEERPAPPSTVDGERAAPSQRHPLAPPPFVRQELTEALLTQRTPEAHAAVLAEFRRYRSGPLFTPPSPDGLIVFPGVDGGAEWGGAAFDPDKGLLYVNANEMPWILEMRELPAPGALPLGARVYAQHCAVCHGASRQGSPRGQHPPLVGLEQRQARVNTLAVVEKGKGVMPGFSLRWKKMIL